MAKDSSAYSVPFKGTASGLLGALVDTFVLAPYRRDKALEFDMERAKSRGDIQDYGNEYVKKRSDQPVDPSDPGQQSTATGVLNQMQGGGHFQQAQAPQLAPIDVAQQQPQIQGVENMPPFATEQMEYTPFEMEIAAERDARQGAGYDGLKPLMKTQQQLGSLNKVYGVKDYAEPQGGQAPREMPYQVPKNGNFIDRYSPGQAASFGDIVGNENMFKDFANNRTKIQASKNVGRRKFGMQNIPLLDANEDPAIGQLSNYGGIEVADLPEGYTVAPDVKYLDTKTSHVPYDRRQPMGNPIPIDVRQAEQEQQIGSAVGKDVGTTMATFDESSLTIKNSVRYAEEILKMPGFDSAFGIESNVPTIGGSPASDVETRYRQLQGRVFSEAYKALKGGGPISDVEGEKMTSAMSSLELAASDEEARKAIRDFQRTITELWKVRARKAGREIEEPGQDEIKMNRLIELRKKYGR